MEEACGGDLTASAEVINSGMIEIATD